MIMRLRYAWHWLTFKIRGIFNPYVLITPCGKGVNAYRFERTKFGFILWGRQKRRHYSWRSWTEGPCNYATYVWMRSPNFAEDYTKWLKGRIAA